MITQEQIGNLIERSKADDRKAFAQLILEFQERVFRLAFRLLCQDEEARDMTQEVFIKVWLSLDKYDSTYRFSTWLYRVTCNMCYDRLRALQRSPFNYAVEDAKACNVASRDDIEEHMINRELKDLIMRFTEELSPKQKIVFTLRDVEELEVSEVILITGMTGVEIKQNLYHARKIIRSKINQINAGL